MYMSELHTILTPHIRNTYLKERCLSIIEIFNYTCLSLLCPSCSCPHKTASPAQKKETRCAYVNRPKTHTLLSTFIYHTQRRPQLTYHYISLSLHYKSVHLSPPPFPCTHSVSWNTKCIASIRCFFSLQTWHLHGDDNRRRRPDVAGLYFPTVCEHLHYILYNPCLVPRVFTHSSRTRELRLYGRRSLPPTDKLLQLIHT